jgi:hypothetical protein
MNWMRLVRDALRHLPWLRSEVDQVLGQREPITAADVQRISRASKVGPGDELLRLDRQITDLAAKYPSAYQRVRHAMPPPASNHPISVMEAKLAHARGRLRDLLFAIANEPAEQHQDERSQLKDLQKQIADLCSRHPDVAAKVLGTVEAVRGDVLTSERRVLKALQQMLEIKEAGGCYVYSPAANNGQGSATWVPFGEKLK